MKTNRVWLGIASGLLVLLSGACRQSDLPPVAANADRADSAPQTRAPAARTIVRTVPTGTVMQIELLDRLASNTSATGDRFRARVARDVVVDGGVAIPAGAPVSGVVTEAVGLKKIGGTPKLRLEFTEVDLSASRDAELHASYAVAGKSETKKDAATIGGAAAGGAILGRIIGHQKDNDARGTAIGGVVGAAAGTAIAAKTKGQEIVLGSGHLIDIVLDEPIRVSMRG